MMNLGKFGILIGVLFYSSSLQLFAQGIIAGKTGVNTITTAVPFLLIAPDSKAGGMGETGVATQGDAYSNHWNPSKMTFAEKDFGVALSYSPWLKQLVPDISLMYLSGYKKIDKTSAIGVSLRYFSLGNIQFTNEYGEETVSHNPNEYAVDISYSRLLSKRFSGGIALRYMNSNLTAGQVVQGSQTKAGRAVAVDVSGIYLNEKIEVLGKDAEFAFGFNISNIGNKMSYSTSVKRDFIPINLRIGPRLTMDLDEYNSITFTIDFNKLLVPTTPIYARDSNSQVVFDSNGQPVIANGRDPNTAVASGMFGSFTDAPGSPKVDDSGNLIQNDDGTYQIQEGSVFVEELSEINIAVGLEYWYNKQFAIRGGYFWESAYKGNRKFFTLGAGIKYNVFGLDFAYLIPAYFGANTSVTSPLKNTLRFSLSFDFEGLKKITEAAPVSN